MSFLTILYWVSHIWSFWALSQFECVSFVTILVWVSSHFRLSLGWVDCLCLSVWLLLLFDLCYHYLVVTWWRPKTVQSFCYKVEKLSETKAWISSFLVKRSILPEGWNSEISLCHNLSFWVLSQFGILSFVTFGVFEFCQNLNFWV